MSNDDAPADGTVSTRRRVLKAAGLVGAGALLPVAAAGTDALAATESAPAGVPTAGTDWPQAGADAGHSSHLPDGVAPASDPTERWRYRNDRYHEGVAVVGDVVYVGGKSLAAVDLAGGSERWSYAPAPPPEYEGEEGNTPEFGTPAVAGGTVYAGLGWGPYDAGTPDAVLAAVDAASGEERWWFDPDGHGNYSTPVVADGTIYAVGQRTDGEARTVFALAPDGSVRWQRSVGDGGWVSSVAVADGLVYANAATGVVALDAATGEEQWHALTDVELTVPPVVHDGRLYVGEANEPGVTLVALDAATGEEQWRTAYTPEYEALSIGAVDDDRVYVQMRYSDADVVALDVVTGEEQWRTTVEYEPPPDYYTDGLARVGDYLYAGSVCLDPADGSVVWKHGLDVTASGWWLGAAARGVVVLLGTEVVALEGPTDGGTTETTTEMETTETTEATETETETTTETTGTETTEAGTTTTEAGTTTAETTRTTTESGTPTDSPGTTTTTSSRGGDCDI